MKVRAPLIGYLMESVSTSCERPFLLMVRADDVALLTVTGIQVPLFVESVSSEFFKVAQFSKIMPGWAVTLKTYVNTTDAPAGIPGG